MFIAITNDSQASEAEKELFCKLARQNDIWNSSFIDLIATRRIAFVSDAFFHNNSTLRIFVLCNPGKPSREVLTHPIGILVDSECRLKSSLRLGQFPQNVKAISFTANKHPQLTISSRVGFFDGIEIATYRIVDNKFVELGITHEAEIGSAGIPKTGYLFDSLPTIVEELARTRVERHDVFAKKLSVKTGWTLSRSIKSADALGLVGPDIQFNESLTGVKQFVELSASERAQIESLNELPFEFVEGVLVLDVSANTTLTQSPKELLRVAPIASVIVVAPDITEHAIVEFLTGFVQTLAIKGNPVLGEPKIMELRQRFAIEGKRLFIIR